METLTTYRLSREERREAAHLFSGLTKVFEADPDLSAATRDRLEISLTWFWRNGSNPVNAERFQANLDALDRLIQRLREQANPDFWAAAISAAPHAPTAPEDIGDGLARSRRIQADQIADFRRRIVHPAPGPDNE